MNHKTLKALEQFDNMPDTALVSLATASAVASRSRASLYRDHEAGRLPFKKVGSSTRIKVADLRRFIGAAA